MAKMASLKMASLAPDTEEALQPITPDAYGVAVLLLTVVALVLFTRDRIPLETSSLTILIVLIAGFQLFPYPDEDIALGARQFFAGFGNEALIAIGALLMLGKALETTGALQPLATVVGRTWSKWPVLALLFTLAIGGVMSAFLNNTPIVVLLMPILVGVSLRVKMPVSGMMMPLGFATIIGGMSTTIGASANLLVVGIARDMGFVDFSMFDFVLPVVIVGGAGILFLWLLAPRLLPERIPPMADVSPRVFSGQLHIKEGGFAAGKSLSEILSKTDGRMRIDRVQRGESLFLAKLPSLILQPGDRLFVKDTPENLKLYETTLGVTLYGSSDTEHPVDAERPLTATGQQLAEVVVTRGSPLHLRNLAATRFSSMYGLSPLAIHRARVPSSQVTTDLNQIRLRAGDVLLVQGTRAAIDRLKASGSMLVLDGTTDLPHTQKANTALGIVAFVIVAAATGVLPISVSALAGVGLMLATSCLRWRDALSALSTRVILVIVTSLALAKALVGTGMASFLALGFVNAAGGLPVPVTLSAFLLMMILLTNVVPNTAVAVISTPISLAIAFQLGARPEPFVLAVLFGASMSFATPFGYQTNLLILSAGGYRFSDFIRVGIPLSIIMWIGFSLVLPYLY
jgi:di/tricarboxylate transporter